MSVDILFELRVACNKLEARNVSSCLASLRKALRELNRQLNPKPTFDGASVGGLLASPERESALETFVLCRQAVAVLCRKPDIPEAIQSIGKAIKLYEQRE